ncbi:hypothetical protein ACRAWB_18410 [Leifsonia poae]|uniref:hypothetical protein n=1 Tax=Leifsonia poae TaxID=110933 RepID=UPI003D69F5B5
MDGATRGERHSDDELASALEEEVARITSAIPIIVPRAETTAVEAVPVEAQPAAEDGEDDSDDGQWVGPPTELISFDDLPARREPTGPEPTFSPWVATAAIPVQRAEPAELEAPPQEPSPEPEPTPEPPAYRPIARAEPLDFVPPELAPRDSEPVPVVPLPQPEPENKPEPTVETPPAPVAAVEPAPTPAAEPESAPDAASEPAPHPAGRHARASILTPEASDLEPTPSTPAPAEPPACSGCGSRAPPPSSAWASARPSSSSG